MGLRAAREASGKTQKRVADEIRISEIAYQRYEYGQREPGVRTAIRIAKALNKDIGEMETLFGESEELQKQPDGNQANS